MPALLSSRQLCDQITSLWALVLGQESYTEVLLQADAGLKLASLIKLAVSRVTKPGKHTAMSQPPGLADAAAAATALLELVVGDEAASQRAVGDGVVPPLLYLYQHGEKQEALAAASLLRALHQGETSAPIWRHKIWNLF